MGEDNHNVWCRGCLEMIYGPAYFCTTCRDGFDRFAMHKSCAELPPQIQRDVYHPHPLTFCLTSMIVCDGCGRLLSSIIGYTCMDCAFNLCCRCACAIAFLKDESDIAKHEALEGRRIKTTIDHFSHLHQLTRCRFFFPESTEDEIKPNCVACKKNLYGAVSYICLPCGFYVHESCINDMPTQVQSPFHTQHILFPREIRKGSRRCNACREAVTGISFCCIKCDAIYHILCAKYQTRAIKHNCHPHHLLQLGKSIINRIACDTCGKRCIDSSFSCRMCDFDIHLECIPLPSNVKHRRHLHQLVLLKSPFLEDDSDEYYCDMCEKKRNPEHHVYYCEECNYIGHIACAVSEVEPTEENFVHPQRIEENSDEAKNIAMEEKRLEWEGILLHNEKVSV
ncbi:hypothetical protein DITRI_Ditri06bG0141400 [Diplodiscus trichospermus]